MFLDRQHNCDRAPMVGDYYLLGAGEANQLAKALVGVLRRQYLILLLANMGESATISGAAGRGSVGFRTCPYPNLPFLADWPGSGGSRTKIA